MTIWRKGNIATAFLAAALLFAMRPALAETQLKVMVFQGLQNLPLFAAQEKGFFKKRDLNVELLIAPTSGELRDGLAQGRHQIAHSAVDNAVAMAEVAKVDVAVVIGGDNGWNSLFVQPNIGSIKDLRGKIVLVDAPNTAYALVLYKMLELNGLKKGDYDVKPHGATFRRLDEMLKDKSVAASILNPPHSIRGEKGGLKDMGKAVKALGPYLATSGFVLRDWGKANADTLVRYIQSYVEGVRWALNPANKAEAIKLLAARLKLPDDIATQSYAMAIDPADGIAKDARIDTEGFANVLKLRAEFQGNAPAAPDKYIDASYYRRALAGL